MMYCCFDGLHAIIPMWFYILFVILYENHEALSTDFHISEILFDF